MIRGSNARIYSDYHNLSLNGGIFLEIHTDHADSFDCDDPGCGRSQIFSSSPKPALIQSGKHYGAISCKSDFFTVIPLGPHGTGTGYQLNKAVS